MVLYGFLCWLCRILYLFAMDAKFLLEEALAFQELANHGLSRGQVPILRDKATKRFLLYVFESTQAQITTLNK